MSTYAVPEDKLTAIADAIRLKRDLTTDMTLDDMALQIALIDGGGSSAWEKVFDFTRTYNVASDTTFSSLTPSTSGQNIMAAISDVKDTNNVAVRTPNLDLANKTYIGYGICMVDLAFKSAPSNAYTFKRAVLQTISVPHIFSRDIARSVSVVTDAYALGYDNNYKSYVYGIMPCALNFVQAGNALNTQLKLTTAALAMRGHNTYFPVNDVKLIDATQSNVICRWVLFEQDGIAADRQFVMDVSRDFLKP